MPKLWKLLFKPEHGPASIYAFMGELFGFESCKFRPLRSCPVNVERSEREYS